MKKFVYISILTCILIFPILFWLNFQWNISFYSFDFKKLRFAFVKDKFLFFATSFNIILYSYSVFTILKIKPSNTKKIPHKNPMPKNDINQNSSQQSWQNIYDTKRFPLDNKNLEQPVNSNPVPKIDEKAPIQNNIINMPNANSQIYSNQIENLLVSMGYEIMGDLFIADTYIDIIAIAESDTLLLLKLNSLYGDVIANETSSNPDNPPSWFTNENRYPSPVFEIKNAHQEFLALMNEVLPQDNGVNVLPIVIMTTADIINKDDISSKWKEQNVEVAKFYINSSLPDISSIIPDKNGTNVLESYKVFVSNMIKYFSKKYKKNSIKKVV